MEYIYYSTCLDSVSETSKLCVIGNFTKVTVYEIGSDVLFGIVVNLFGWIKTYSCCKL